MDSSKTPGDVDGSEDAINNSDLCWNLTDDPFEDVINLLIVLPTTIPVKVMAKKTVYSLLSQINQALANFNIKTKNAYLKKLKNMILPRFDTIKEELSTSLDTLIEFDELLKNMIKMCNDEIKKLEKESESSGTASSSEEEYIEETIEEYKDETTESDITTPYGFHPFLWLGTLSPTSFASFKENIHEHFKKHQESVSTFSTDDKINMYKSIINILEKMKKKCEDVINRRKNNKVDDGAISKIVKEAKKTKALNTLEKERESLHELRNYCENFLNPNQIE